MTGKAPVCFPVRIAVLASTLVIGGAEQVLKSLLLRLDRKRFPVDMVFLNQPGPLGQELVRLGLPHRQGLLRRRLDPGAPFRLARLFKELGTDVVLVINHQNALAYAVAATRLAGGPPVINWHNETHRRYRFHALTMLARSVLHLGAARVVAAAKGHKDYVVRAERVSPDKVDVIYNGVDPDAFRSDLSPTQAKIRLGLPENAPVAAIVAALRPDKAHGIFLQAASRISKRLPRARFLVVGDGERRAFLEDTARRLDVADKTLFLGFRRDMADVLRAADALALSSLPWQETLSVAMLEAMAAGLPVVVPDVGFLSEAVRDGQNGFLVPVGDASALADRLALVLGDAALRARLGAQAARDVAEHFSATVMTREFENLFIRLASTRPRPQTRRT